MLTIESASATNQSTTANSWTQIPDLKVGMNNAPPAGDVLLILNVPDLYFGQAPGQGDQGVQFQITSGISALDPIGWYSFPNVAQNKGRMPLTLVVPTVAPRSGSAFVSWLVYGTGVQANFDNATLVALYDTSVGDV